MMHGPINITCRVSFQNKNKSGTLVLLVGFNVELILRRTALWTPNVISPNLILSSGRHKSSYGTSICTPNFVKDAIIIPEQDKDKKTDRQTKLTFWRRNYFFL